MKTNPASRLGAVIIVAAGLLVSMSPVVASAARPGDTGPRSSGLRLSTSSGGRLGNTLPVGGTHTCAVIADGTVRCWGDNSAGQLGNGSTVASSVPVTVTTSGGGTLTSVVSVASGARHTCALRADGTVFCWGDNASAKLGLGSTTPSSSSVARPVKAGSANFTGAVMLAAGRSHTCAIRFDGTIHCWGSNLSGQLGLGFFGLTITSPTRVTASGGGDFTGAVSIAAGLSHMCAVHVAGTVHCWGENSSGQLGNGETGTRSHTPVTVSLDGGGDFTGAVSVATGAGHTCALRADGTVHCWGDNSGGQLGNGGLEAVQPVQVLGNAVSLATGFFHTCAVVVGGTVQCWGFNAEGQIGNNQTGGDVLIPTQVSAARLGDAVAVTAGGSHTCARRADDTVRCWGQNVFGQLGNSINADEDEPVPVVGIDPAPSARAIATGHLHTCAARASGNAACWGDNGSGQVGNGTQTDQSSPVAVGGLTGVLAVASGALHTCALRFDGTVWCWGDNSTAQLGNSSAGSLATSPVRVTDITDAVAISAGNRHTCAVRVGGRISCWGYNASAQLGDGSGSTGPKAVPVTVVRLGGGDLLDAIAVAAGGNHTCALHVGGSVSCWGGNTFGEVGDATTVGVRSRAATVVSLPDATALAAGPAANHTCALRVDGSVRCWGRNGDTQLGDGTILNRNFPVPVSVGAIVTLAAGGRHTCALHTSSLVLCWGANPQGQLGNGSTTTPNPPAPVVVLLSVITGVNQPPVIVPFTGGARLAAGSQHTCLLVVTGRVACWGDNGEGQIGDGGRPADRLFATAVPSFAFNVEEAVALHRGGRVATVTALASCEDGARVQVRVRLIQGATSGHGIAIGQCTGALERYEVTVPAHGRAAFVEGAATAEAEAIVRSHGDVLEEPVWTRGVRLAR
jgi:alpha-tubulin suppressor-like RCC1 family protein